MSKSNRRISNLLINPKYQIKYVIWLSGTGLTLVALYSLIIYQYMKENYLLLVELSPMDDATKAQMYRELSRLIMVLGGSSVVFLVIASLLGVLLSHRTAGPLYHFKRVFADVRAGNLSSRVRPGDDFRDVAGSFNEMMDSIQKSPR